MNTLSIGFSHTHVIGDLGPEKFQGNGRGRSPAEEFNEGQENRAITSIHRTFVLIRSLLQADNWRQWYYRWISFKTLFFRDDKHFA